MIFLTKAAAKLKVSQLSPLLNLNKEERRQVRIVMRMMRMRRGIMMKMMRRMAMKTM